MRWLTSGDAETAHEWFLSAMRFVQAHPFARSALALGYHEDQRLRQTLLGGLVFPSPFGIAAGLDKNASIVHALQALASPGFIEIGTVTPRPQPGNARPRIFRADKNNLINAMGFPNEGADAVLARLRALTPLEVPLGLNIGKMKDTADGDTAAEYAQLIRATASLRSARHLPDYYVVNVSSPNTPGLTALQKIEPLTEIVDAVVAELDALSTEGVNLRHRLLIKLGADIDDADLESSIGLVLRSDLGGVITTNTTMTRPVSSRFNDRPGGFSGSALYDRAAGVVRKAAQLLPRTKVLVATGGIDTVDRAYEMLRYADLVGGYTGLVLQGPRLFRRLSKGVAERMKAAGVQNLPELREEQRPA
ncbi:MAG: quinone-dependent dihydroorotate dehydrogenase [Mycobacteriales bacterium]